MIMEKKEQDNKTKQPLSEAELEQVQGGENAGERIITCAKCGKKVEERFMEAHWRLHSESKPLDRW